MSSDDDVLEINFEEESREKDKQIESLKAEINLLKQSNCRSNFEATQMLLLAATIPPYTRITENNRLAAILLEQIQPELAKIKLKSNILEIEQDKQGILSRWSSNSSILGFTQINYHYDCSETLARPIFSFQNFLKYFDPNSLTSSKGLMSLLTKFDRRLEKLSWASPPRCTYSTSSAHYLGITVIPCLPRSVQIILMRTSTRKWYFPLTAGI